MIRPAFVPLGAVALIDLLNRVVDGADALACRGYLFDPDPPHEWTMPPEEAFTELAGLVGGCRLCRIGPSALGDHWLNLQREKYERSLPAWRCTCGAVYKVLSEGPDHREFYEALDDGLRGPLCAGASGPACTEDCPHGSCPEILFGGGGCLPGARVGVIRKTSKGKVRHSDPCPGCGERFADVIAGQQRAANIRRLPAWTCDCGAVYRSLGEPGGGQEFYAVTGDGYVEQAGVVRVTGKGKVRHSDACPGCGRQFAATLARQAEPQQPLFDEYDLRGRP